MYVYRWMDGWIMYAAGSPLHSFIPGLFNMYKNCSPGYGGVRVILSIYYCLGEESGNNYLWKLVYLYFHLVYDEEGERLKWMGLIRQIS